MREGQCGAPLWLRPSLSLVFRLRGRGTDSTRARRRARRGRPGIRLRPDQPRTDSRTRAVRLLSIRAVRLRSTRAEQPRNTRVDRPQITLRPARRIRRLPIAGTQAHLMMARLVLGPATPVRRLRDTWGTGSISTVECRCRIRSGCCTTIPTSIGFLPATSSG